MSFRGRVKVAFWQRHALIFQISMCDASNPHISWRYSLHPVSIPLNSFARLTRRAVHVLTPGVGLVHTGGSHAATLQASCERAHFEVAGPFPPPLPHPYTWSAACSRGAASTRDPFLGRSFAKCDLACVRLYSTHFGTGQSGRLCVRQCMSHACS